MTSTERTSSRKRKSADLNDFPQNMQFYKWAKLDKVSDETIKRLQDICWGEPIEVSEVIYKLIQYIRRQREKEKEYKDKMKKDAKGVKSSAADGTATDKVKCLPDGKSTITSVEDSTKPDDEIQVLMERRREILQEIGEENEEEESDSDPDEDSKKTDERMKNGDGSPQETASSASNQQPVDITTISAHSILPAIAIKQEVVDEPVATSAPAAPLAATSPAVRQTPPASTARTLPMKAEPPAITPSSANVIEHSESALSTISLADAPLSTYAIKTIKTEKAAAATQAIPPKAKQTIVSAAAALQPVLQLQMTAAPLPAAVNAAEAPKAQQRAKKPVKREHVPPVHQFDPEEVKILSTHLVELNVQVDFLNKIKEQAAAQNLPCEFFYKNIEKFADASPRFTMKYFKALISCITTIANRIDCELSQFEQPSVSPLKITVQSVKTEINAIFERVKGALAEYRATKAAEALQKEVQQQTQKAQAKSRWDNNTKESWQPLKQREKRHLVDTQSVPDSHQPATKRTKKPLLETPATGIGSEARPGNGNAPPRNMIAPAEAPSLDSCAFCDESHDPIHCHNYNTPKEREDRRAELKLCWACLQPFSRAHRFSCPGHRKYCSHCGTHQSHAALCRSLHKPPRTQWDRRPRPPFNRVNPIIERRDESEGAEFSPSSTPIHEEEVKSTESVQLPSID